MKFVDWYVKIGVVSTLIGASMELFMIKTGFCMIIFHFVLWPLFTILPFWFPFSSMNLINVLKAIQFGFCLLWLLIYYYCLSKWFFFFKPSFGVNAKETVPKLLVVKGCACICIEFYQSNFFFLGEC